MTDLRPPFRTIVCGVDFSAESAGALRHAAALARAADGQLTAIYINDPLLLAAAATGYDSRTLEDTAYEELRQFIQRTLGRKGAPAVRFEVAIGPVPSTILKAARRLRADLVVLGTQGLSGVRKLFFGSTTLRVLQTTTMPVLAVPPSRTVPRRHWPSGVMVVPIDLGREAARELRTASALAQAWSAPLVVVHVVAQLRAPSWLGTNRRAYDRARVSKARARLDALTAEADDSGHVERRVLVGDPAETVAAVATDVHADLLVMTLRAPTQLLGSRPGAVAYRVLCRAPAPVLALPPGFLLALRRERRHK